MSKIAGSDKAREKKALKEKRKKERDLRKQQKEEKQLERISNKEKRLMQAIEKKRKTMLEEIENETLNTAVKVMNFKLVKGSPEHIALRQKLYDLKDEKERVEKSNWRDLLTSDEMKDIEKTFEIINEAKAKEKAIAASNKDYISSTSADDLIQEPEVKEPKKRGRKKQNDNSQENEEIIEAVG